MASSFDHLSLAWTWGYDALKKFFSEDIKLEGIWEQPGGDEKVFKMDNMSISWRRNKNLFDLDGKDEEVGRVTRLLCDKVRERLYRTSETRVIDVQEVSCLLIICELVLAKLKLFLTTSMP